MSFDVFDTVVFRKQGTWEAFLVDLGSHLVRAGLIVSHLAPQEFARLRRTTEADAHAAVRPLGRKALPLEAIYASFPGKYLTGGTTPAALAQAEFEFELSSDFALPATLDLIGKLADSGKRICFTTNTYFRAPQMRLLLSAVGVPAHCLDHVFCSCEFGKGKQHGLFSDVLETLHLAPQNLVHCGDNLGTDIKAAAARGIETSQYKGRLDLWISGSPTDGPVTISDSVRTSARFDPESDPFGDFGYTVLGPVVAGFVSWLLDLAVHEKRNRLVFAEREGVFFKKAADLVLSMVDDDASSRIETDLIAISRRAVMPLLAGESRFLDLQTDLFARRLQLGASEVAPDRDPDLVRRTRAYVTNKLEDLAGSIFVDIGYKGTISHVLNATLKNEAGVALLAAYFLASPSANRKDSPARTYLPEDGTPPDLLARTMKGLAFLEQCFMPPLGSVVGYDADLEPVRESFVIAPSQTDEQNAVQEGILAYVSDFVCVCRALEVPLRQAVFSRKKAVEELLSLFGEPTPRVGELASRWQHEINFGTEQLVPVSAKPSFSVVGSSMNLLLNGRSWIGPLRDVVPLSLTASGVGEGSVHVSLTTDRGPIGPGSVRGRFPASAPSLAHFSSAPIGEVFWTLRLSRPDLGASALKVTLFGSMETMAAGEEPTFERAAFSPRSKRVDAFWRGSACQVISDESRLLRACKAAGEDLVLTFSETDPSNVVLLVLEPFGERSPKRRNNGIALRNFVWRVAIRSGKSIYRLSKNIRKRVGRR